MTCWPFLCCRPAREDVALRISHPTPLRPRPPQNRKRRPRTGWRFVFSSRRDSTVAVSAHGNAQGRHGRAHLAGGVSLTTLPTEDLHLLEEYKYRARVGSWSRSTSRTGGEGEGEGIAGHTDDVGDVPLRNLLGERHEHNRTPVSASDNGRGRIPHPERTRSRSPPGLSHMSSRDYISLRSGTPLSLVVEARNGHTPSPPPLPPVLPAFAAVSAPSRRKSPLATQQPWNKVLPPSPPSKRKSIRLVGPCGDGDDQSGITGTRLFTPLPLEIDFSPFDVEFRKLVIDVPADEDEEEEEQRLSLLGSRKEEEFRQRQGQDRSIKGKEMEDSSWDPNGACRTLRPFQQQPRMPSRPKLVHFATTPSFSRRLPEGGADKQTEYDADDALGKGDVKTRSKKRVSSSPVNEQLASNRASRSSYTSDNYRLFTPIRNLSHSPPPPSPPPSAVRRPSSSSSSHKRRSLSTTVRTSIQRDLVPTVLHQDDPGSSRYRQSRKSRPDPALFPGVIPYAFSPRDVGLRQTEREWRRFNEQQQVVGNVVSAPVSAGETDRHMEAGRGKRWSWSGRMGRRADGRVVAQRLAESEGEGERERDDDEWEVLR